jgi:hypothetical protein
MLLMLAAALLLAAPLQARDLTLYAGRVMPGSIDNISLKGSSIFGARLATNFVPLFGMEHTLALSSNYLFPKNDPAIQDAKGFVYNSNLIVSLPVPIKSAVPYLTAGAGLLHQYGDRNLPVGTKFAFNYGGGVKIPHLAGPLGLRLDLRGYSTSGIFSSNVNMLEVSGGLLLSMGK